jgi:tetratricopeptide (TPR) repeat protein
MSLIVGLTAWLVGAIAAAPDQACTPAATQAMDQAAQAVLAGDPAAARDLLRRASEPQSGCALLSLAARAQAGWESAMDAAKVGGTAEALAPTRDVLKGLEAQPRPGATPEAYATAMLHAAAAASQDERAELKVWIEHGRLIASRMALAGETATWPMPIDLAEASLWMLVDDYEQAEAAFDSAVKAKESLLGLAGLARARDRRGNKAGACSTFRRLLAIAPANAKSSALATEARGYTLLCDP